MFHLCRINKFWGHNDSLGSKVQIAMLNTWNFLRLDIKCSYHRATIWKYGYVHHLDGSNHFTMNMHMGTSHCISQWQSLLKIKKYWEKINNIIAFRTMYYLSLYPLYSQIILKAVALPSYPKDLIVGCCVFMNMAINQVSF